MLLTFTHFARQDPYSKDAIHTTDKSEKLAEGDFM